MIVSITCTISCCIFTATTFKSTSRSTFKRWAHSHCALHSSSCNFSVKWNSTPIGLYFRKVVLVFWLQLVNDTIIVLSYFKAIYRLHYRSYLVVRTENDLPYQFRSIPKNSKACFYFEARNRSILVWDIFTAVLMHCTFIRKRLIFQLTAYSSNPKCEK